MRWFRNWKCIRVSHCNDISYSDRKDISPELAATYRKGMPSTHATYLCTRTGKIKTEYYYDAGYLTVEELNCAYKE